ncbi:hypothetical protein IW140_001741 [Coemansia sp. RSA 1813]|nr:hypothetical protein EV178_001535 [Coemansia sp. RSA 1646]KAJ1772483.1 hypothetical protein LPJ74_001383 [Coemansia sp. RSA 1843]KAJ2090886.1 hypothetical protein IW138_002289 [Coemansia sp. RSA 986]KAJ2213168.1 hypothetical protein EV179_004043 [Coemansia sp. RSA 487]KAJ2571286.1 hypothetical protein IW140_001741 [Coemansia sp. RSA 1813]
MANSTASTYTLRYFNVVGIIEPIRLLFLASKVNWTEVHPEWPQAKFDQPFGRMPVLIEKSADGSPDFVLTESRTIERYLARKYGFMPANLKDAARQEQLRDLQADVGILSNEVRLGAGDEAKERLTYLIGKLISFHTEILRENGNTGHFFGNELSYIDMSLYGFFKLIFAHPPTSIPTYVQDIKGRITPEIAKVIDNVENHLLLRDHITSNPEFYPLFK